jgi:hypothetical protein
MSAHVLISLLISLQPLQSVRPTGDRTSRQRVRRARTPEAKQLAARKEQLASAATSPDGEPVPGGPAGCGHGGAWETVWSCWSRQILPVQAAGVMAATLTLLRAVPGQQSSDRLVRARRKPRTLWLCATGAHDFRPSFAGPSPDGRSTTRSHKNVGSREAPSPHETGCLRCSSSYTKTVGHQDLVLESGRRQSYLAHISVWTSSKLCDGNTKLCGWPWPPPMWTAESQITARVLNDRIASARSAGTCFATLRRCGATSIESGRARP